MIYFDYAASTPVDKEVLNTYIEVTTKYYANPNSNHKLGRNALNLITNSTKNIASNLNILPEEIIYTSGASEANNLAIKGIAERYKNFGRHILISTLEHNSITSSATKLQELGFEVELIPINKDGLIDIESFKKSLRNDTILVSICTVDSEIGLRQPIEEIGNILKNYPNCYFHTDATQAIGKIPVDFSNVDLVTFAPHKFYGLTGIGVLIKKKNVSLKPQIDGGKSLTIYRSGTPETALIVSLDIALDIALKSLTNRYKTVEVFYNKIKNTLKDYPKVIINNKDNSIPYTINFSLKGLKSTELQNQLAEHNIYLSTKTSCCPIETPSKLVYALTHDKNISLTSIRLSLSHLTTKNEVEEFLKVFDKIYKEYEENGKI